MSVAKQRSSGVMNSDGKSDTSQVNLPYTIVADDGSIRTMSPIESPLSLARRRLTAQMINERVAMIRAGMTPEEVIAFYEAKDKAEKKKDKAKKALSKQPTILEIPDLNETETLLPAPPPVTTGSRKQSLKVATQQQPSHFKAFSARLEPSRMRRSSETETNIKNIPKPGHYMAFEEASQSSKTDEQRSAIRTKTLQRLQSSGGPAPPHYMALEMVSQKKVRSSSSRKSLPKGLDSESPTSKSRIIGEKLATLTQNVENDRRRRNGTDLSAELSAFFATNKKAALKAKQAQQEAKVTRTIDKDSLPLKEGARRGVLSASQSFGAKAVTDTQREGMVGKAASVRRSDDGAACERKIERTRPLRRRHSIEGIVPRTSIRNCKDVVSLTKSLESMRVEEMNLGCSPAEPLDSMRRVEEMNIGWSVAPLKENLRRRHSHHMMLEGHSIEDNKRHALMKRKS